MLFRSLTLHNHPPCKYLPTPSHYLYMNICSYVHYITLPTDVNTIFFFFHRKLPHYIFFHTQKQASTNIPTLVNACSPILTEINFYKRPDGRSKTVPELPERGLAGDGFLLLRTISHFTYEMVNNQRKLPRRAILGSIGMDAVASGSSG